MRRLRPALGAIWPKRLAPQLIALLLFALLATQIVSLVILLDERRHALRAADRAQVLARTASIVRLVEATPPELHPHILRTASSPRLRFWVADDHAVDATIEANRHNPLQQRLDDLLEGDGQQVLVELTDERGDMWDWLDHRRNDDQARVDAHEGDDQARVDGDLALRQTAAAAERRREHRSKGRHMSLIASVLLTDGRWLNVETRFPRASVAAAVPSLIGTGVMAVAISVIVALMIRRMTRPMADLAAAAERLGRGEAVPPVPEGGPEEVRQTTRAFNRMHDRLQRFVQDRTRMLAAISHDLRTPLTSLRLRAEFVDDDETRAKILETLYEMERMTEATLAFAREEARREDTRTVDLAALVDSLCEDLRDLDMDVAYSGPPSLLYPCRSVSLKRALRNLIENAVTYGGRARVTLTPAEQEMRVVIDDDGPGIPEADFERVFAPFVRLEESRSQETGGIGLGMAIARSIVRGHGGDITLANREGGGLRVTLHLPRVGPA
jgi:signal transduction histidine kinase